MYLNTVYKYSKCIYKWPGKVTNCFQGNKLLVWHTSFVCRCWSFVPLHSEWREGKDLRQGAATLRSLCAGESRQKLFGDWDVAFKYSFYFPIGIFLPQIHGGPTEAPVRVTSIYTVPEAPQVPQWEVGPIGLCSVTCGGWELIFV